MRVTSIAAVMIAVSGPWLPTLFKGHGHVVSVNAAAPGSFAASGPSFGPLRNDICEDGMGNSFSSTGLEGKQMLGAAPNTACGKYQPRDGTAADE